MPSSPESRRTARANAKLSSYRTKIGAAVMDPADIPSAPDVTAFHAIPSPHVVTIAPQVGRCYRTRAGDMVRITLKRNAIGLDGKTLEPVIVGIFLEGSGLCAWWPNGIYRASSGLHPYGNDIVEELPL